MAKRKRGRPTEYTPEAADEILSRLIDGESLRSICADEHLPSKGAVLGWVVDDREHFADRYRRAREVQAEILADEIVELADRGTTDVNRDRLSVDTRKWYLAKMLPKFRDRISVNLEEMTDDELAALAAGKPAE